MWNKVALPEKVPFVKHSENRTQSLRVSRKKRIQINEDNCYIKDDYHVKNCDIAQTMLWLGVHLTRHVAYSIFDTDSWTWQAASYHQVCLNVHYKRDATKKGLATCCNQWQYTLMHQLTNLKSFLRESINLQTRILSWDTTTEGMHQNLALVECLQCCTSYWKFSGYNPCGCLLYQCTSCARCSTAGENQTMQSGASPSTPFVDDLSGFDPWL